MTHPVKGYLSIVTTRFRVLFQYRAAALGGVFTQTFFGLVRVMILEAFYRASDARPSMTFAQAAGYVWLGQAMLTLFPWNTDRDVRDLIRNGTVAYELCRPLDLYGLWFSRAIALRTAPVLLRMVPMFVVAIAVLPLVGLDAWRLEPPPSLAAGAVWLASVFASLLLSCAFTCLMSITLLWTIDDTGVTRIFVTLVTVFGGLIIPLPLFPEWAQPVLRALPFAGTMDLPGRLYTGHIPVAEAGGVIASQLAWTAALILFGRWLLGRAIRRLVVQGG
jgi:ABC-2 type transport system permease protein